MLKKDQLNVLNHDYQILLILRSIEKDWIVTFMTQHLYEAKIKLLNIRISNLNEIIKLIPDSHIAFFIKDIIGKDKFVGVIQNGDDLARLLKGISISAQKFILDDI